MQQRIFRKVCQKVVSDFTKCLKQVARCLAHEKEVGCGEMRMLRWMCEVTKLDGIWNERIIEGQRK